MKETEVGRNGSSPALTRRDLLKGMGSLGLASLLGSAGFPLRALAESLGHGLVFPLQRGPYQNNGASPWYTTLPLGTPGQAMKICFDTGSNFNWVTSTLCAPTGCQHYGGKRFDYKASSSFAWTNQKDQKVDFGPWGSMIVQTGKDVLGLPNAGTSPIDFYLAKEYSGPQFEQLDWDGGIGLPSGTPCVPAGASFFFGDLMDAGLIDPELPYIAFDTDAAAKKGTCRLGGIDPGAYDPFSWIRMKWQPYMEFPGVQYIWSTPLRQYSVGDTVLAKDVVFALDSGSSELKGDDGIMNKTLALVAKPPKPDVTLVVGETSQGPGKIILPPSVYDVLIEEGPDKGKTVPQFTPLGLTDLVLVGSVVMDLFYTVYEYEVTSTPGGHYLTAANLWLFNKAEGPRLIQQRGAVRSTVGERKPVAQHTVRRF